MTAKLPASRPQSGLLPKAAAPQPFTRSALASGAGAIPPFPVRPPGTASSGPKITQLPNIAALPLSLLDRDPVTHRRFEGDDQPSDRSGSDDADGLEGDRQQGANILAQYDAALEGDLLTPVFAPNQFSALGLDGGGGMDFESLADALGPLGEDSGIFEVELAGGNKMGVVVQAQAGSVSFLLTPQAGSVGERLRKQRVELERHVERRIKRQVAITVL